MKLQSSISLFSWLVYYSETEHILYVQNVLKRSSNNSEEHSYLKHWEPKMWKLVHYSEVDDQWLLVEVTSLRRFFFSYKCSKDQVLENVAILRSIYTIEYYNPTSVKSIRGIYVIFFHPSWFVFSYQCIQNVYRNKIISHERDLVGVVFYGTEQHNNTMNCKHIYVLQDLNNPGKAGTMWNVSVMKEFRDTLCRNLQIACEDIWKTNINSVALKKLIVVKIRSKFILGFAPYFVYKILQWEIGVI